MRRKPFDQWKEINDNSNDLYSKYSGSPVFYDWEAERKEMLEHIKKLYNHLKMSEEIINEMINLPSVNARTRTKNLINEIENIYLK